MYEKLVSALHDIGGLSEVGVVGIEATQLTRVKGLAKGPNAFISHMLGQPWECPRGGGANFFLDVPF